MNNNTTRHTARPSRLRVTLARVGAWLDRHDDAVTLGAVAFIVATVSALLALALAIDHAMRTRDALAVAVIAIALSTLSGFFAYTVGSDRATSRVSRRYSRYLNEQSDKHERALARVMRERDEAQRAMLRVIDQRDELLTHIDEVRKQRDEARREASRNAYALLTALEESDAR